MCNHGITEKLEGSATTSRLWTWVQAFLPDQTMSTVLKVSAAVTLFASVTAAYVLVHEHRRKGKKERKAASAAAAASAGGGSDGAGGSMSQERLVSILAEMARAAYQLIEQVRTRRRPPGLALPLLLLGRTRRRRRRPAAARPARGPRGPACVRARASDAAPSSDAPRQFPRARSAQTRKMVQEKHTQSGMELEKCVDELQKDFEAAMETVMASIRAKHGVTEAAMNSSMVWHQSNLEVTAAVQALREAMAGKPPPNYEEQMSQAHAEAAKARARRGKSRRKG